MDILEFEERLAYMQRERDEALSARDAEREKSKEKLATAGKLIAALKKELDHKSKALDALDALVPFLQEFVRQAPAGYYYDTEDGECVSLSIDDVEKLLEFLEPRSNRGKLER